MNTHTIPLPKKIICIMLSLAMVIAFVPALAFSAFADEEAAQTQQVNIDIDAMVEAGNYEEGEVIAIVRADLESNSDANHEAESLLDSAETLMGTSTNTAEEALNVSVPSARAAVKADASLNAVNTAADEAVEIVLVKDQSKTTRELIEQLMTDARVICAEPSYTYQLADTEESASGNDNIEDGVQLQSSSDATSTTYATTNTETSTDPTSTNAATPTNTKDETSAQKTEQGYDMSSWQWSYTATKAFKRSNDTSDPIDTSGIAGWNTEAGKGNAAGTVVAVLDSGLDYTNDDLKDVTLDERNAAISKECGGGQYGLNATDDGEIGDVMDGNGHGTHCAGIIAASWNDFGTSGAADGAQVLSVRCAKGSSVSISETAAIKGYDYLSKCIDNDMNIVAANNSWGGDYCCNTALTLAITKLGKKGCISTFAAGNANLDNDIHMSTITPGAENPYLITVDAARHTDKKASYSSYGQVTTNVFSAGSEYVSTYAGNKVKQSYGPADLDPAYRNYFTDSDISKHLIVSDVRYDNEGAFIFPTSYKDLVDNPSKNASYANSSSVDPTDNSGALNLQATSENQGRFWVGIPVLKSDINDIESLSFCSYQPSDNNLGLISFYPTLVNKTETGTKRSVPNITANSTMVNEWVHSNTIMQSFIDSMPKPSSGNWELNYLDTDDENVKILVCCSKVIPSSNEGGYLDALTLHKTEATEGPAAKWALELGTSMATPNVAGCAAVASKQQNLKGADLANYIKAHVRTIDSCANLCTQGGIVDLSVTDAQATPVINKARQEGLEAGNPTSTIRIDGAYFGSAKGNVQIGDKDAEIVSWSNERIVVKAPDDTASGTPLVAVTATNGKTGRLAVKYQAPSSPSQAKLFTDTLASPDASEEIQKVSGGLATASYNPDIHLITQNQMLAMDGKIYLAANGKNEDSVGKLYCYDIANNTWSIATSFGKKLVNCSLATKDGLVYCYGNCDLTEPYLAIYNPSTNSLQEIDATILGTGEEAVFANATLASANDKLMLVGGGSYSADHIFTAKQSDNVAELTIENGILSYKKCGTATPDASTGLAGLGGAQVVEHKGALYVGGYMTVSLQDPTKAQLSPNLIKLTCDESGQWTSEDISSTMPTILHTNGNLGKNGYLPLYGLAASDDGVFISGANADDGNGNRSAYDTYVLKDGADKFEAFNRSADLDTLGYPCSLVYDGYIYTLGTGKLNIIEQGGMYIFRRTPVDDTQYFNVSFDMQGHGTAPATQSVAEGELVEEPETPTAQGYSFGGWYKETSCENKWDFANDRVEGDTTLYAKWTQTPTPEPSPVTPVSDNSGGTGSSASTKSSSTGDSLELLGILALIAVLTGGAAIYLRTKTKRNKN